MTDEHLTPPSEDYNNLKREEVTHVFDALAAEIHSIAVDKGWWSEQMSVEDLLVEFGPSIPIIPLRPSQVDERLRKLIQRARDTMPRNEGEMIALEMSELGECLEGIRHGNPPSDKIPEFSAAEEELADLVIRVLDHARGKGYRLVDALMAKVEYNRSRPYKHGGKTC